MAVSASRAPVATASATFASAARRRARSAALMVACRSACADDASESARPLIARSRSSTVRTSSRASISVLRAADALSVSACLVAADTLDGLEVRGESSFVRQPRLLRPVVLLAGLLGDPPLNVGELAPALLGRTVCRRYRRDQPPGLVLSRPRRPGQRPEPPGDLRRGGVDLLHRGLGLRDRLPGALLVLDRLAQLPLSPLRRDLGLGQLVSGRLRRRPQPKQALPARRPAPGPVRPDQVTLGRHDRDGRIGSHQLKPGSQIRRHQNAAQQPLHRRSQLARRLNKIYSSYNALRALSARSPQASPTLGTRRPASSPIYSPQASPVRGTRADPRANHHLRPT